MDEFIPTKGITGLNYNRTVSENLPIGSMQRLACFKQAAMYIGFGIDHDLELLGWGGLRYDLTRVFPHSLPRLEEHLQTRYNSLVHPVELALKGLGFRSGPKYRSEVVGANPHVALTTKYPGFELPPDKIRNGWFLTNVSY